jgi:hypothetical protein
MSHLYTTRRKLRDYAAALAIRVDRAKSMWVWEGAWGDGDGPVLYTGRLYEKTVSAACVRVVPWLW